MTHDARRSPPGRPGFVAALCAFILLSCSGHRISSWSPSGSLEWERAAEDDEEGADGGTEGLLEDATPAGEAAPGPDGGGPGGVPPVDDPATALARAGRLYAEG